MTPEQIAKRALAAYINDDSTDDYIGLFIELDPDLDDEVFDRVWDESLEALHNVKVNVTHWLTNT